jgi:hypothetical protein
VGTTINSLAEGAEKLLDFEQSLNDELEASILSNKSINLDMARQKAFAGDIAGARDEVLKQVGSVAELEKMNYITQKKVAEAAGLSSAELRKQLTLKQAHAKLNKDELTSAEKAALEEEQMNSELTQMQNKWSTIVNSLSKIFLPVFEAVIPVLNTISNIFVTISNFIDGITGETKGWVGNLAKAVVLIGTIYLSYKGITMLTGKMGGLLGKLGGLGGMGGGGGLGGIFGNLFGNVSGMAKGALGIALMAGAIFILGKAMTSFQGIDWETMAKAGVALVGFTAIMMGLSAVLTLAAPAIGIGAALIGVFVVELLGFGVALQLIASAGDPALKFLQGLATVDYVAIAKLGGAMGVFAAGAMFAAPATAILGGLGLLTGGGGGGSAAPAKRDKLDDVVEGLNRIHDRLSKLEFAVNLDGRKVGRGLAINNAYGT